METELRTTLDGQMGGDRPPYEAPRVLCLNDLRLGSGQDSCDPGSTANTCVTGSRAECCCWPTGNNAINACVAGSSDGRCGTGNSAKIVCEQGGGH